MLARSFDLLSARCLRRILADQIQRGGEQGFGLLQLAAICDLMGLRASTLTINQEQLQRLPCPALLLQEGHPQIIWRSPQLMSLLVIHAPSKATVQSHHSF